VALHGRAAAVIDRIGAPPGEFVDGRDDAGDANPLDGVVTVEEDILAWERREN
jgi:hypothetical protein